MLTVTDEAAEFYKNEWNLDTGDSIKLFVRYGGGGIDGFTLGVDKGEQSSSNIKVTVKGISFYNSPDDDWLIDLAKIDYDAANDEIKFSFES